jgi:biotin transporter BioY
MCSGVSWLGTVLHLAPATAFKMGALPFLPGQIVKVFASAGIVMSIQRLRGN